MREPAAAAAAPVETPPLSPDESEIAGVLPAGPAGEVTPPDAASGPSDPSDANTQSGDIVMRETPAWLIALLAGLAFAGGLGWWLWGKRQSGVKSPPTIQAPVVKTEPEQARGPGTTSGITPGAGPSSGPSSAPGSSAAAAAIASAPKIALELKIASASRSMMMFALDYRLNIANRDDRALRDMKISAKLICARHGSNEAAATQPMQSVERIGPQQSHTISGNLQLPLREINPMQQGSKPLFVPLIEIAIESPAHGAKTHKFVVGLPSASNSTRVHPIPLDGPPGGIPGLRANEIKETASGQSA